MTKGGLVLLVVVFFMGSLAGGCSREVEVVTVTETKYKTIEKTVDVPGDIPESCRRIVDLIPTLLESSSQLTESAGDALLSLQDVQKHAQGEKWSMLGAAITVARRAEMELGSASIDQHKTASEIDKLLARCDTELATE